MSFMLHLITFLRVFLATLAADSLQTSFRKGVVVIQKTFTELFLDFLILPDLS